MRLTNSLRFRVAFAFAVFGTFFSLLLAGSLYYTIDNFGDKLMDQSLQAELEDAFERHQSGLPFIPPASATVRGFVRKGTAIDYEIPAEVADLSPGNYNVSIHEKDYRILIADKGNLRYFMLFNTELQHQLERQLLGYMVLIAILLPLLAGTGGFWMAMHIVKPLARLVAEVNQADPGEIHFALNKLTRNDEVGELARAIDRYVNRLHLFIEREKNFTADMSHEFRTPLAIIAGAVEVLEQDTRLQQSQKQKLLRIKRAVQESKDLGNALLLLAREKKNESEVQGCVVANVLNSCIEKHQYLMEGNPVSLEVEVVGNPMLDAESTLLEVVIGNLVRNAFSYTKSGNVKIRLESNRFIVSDTGIGIHDDELNKIFLPHYRGETSSGAGVGLSLVKRICDRYHWRIKFLSQKTQGTTAEVVFFDESI